jgi:hypothetical protein
MGRGSPPHETLGSMRPWECEACHAPSDSFIGHRDCATCAERRPAHDWPSSSKLYGWCNLRGLNHASVSELGGSSRLMIAGGRLTKVCSNAGAALVPAAIIPRVTIAPSTDCRMLIGMIASIHTGDIVPRATLCPLPQCECEGPHTKNVAWAASLGVRPTRAGRCNAGGPQMVERRKADLPDSLYTTWDKSYGSNKSRSAPVSWSSGRLSASEPAPPAGAGADTTTQLGFGPSPWRLRMARD